MADIRHPRPLLRKLVGEVLRRHRQDQGRTLAEVAREANVSVPYLSEVERGRKEPSSEILAAVCDSLGIELADLLAEVRLELMTATVPVLRLHTTLQPQRMAPPVHRPGDTYLMAA